MQPGNRIVRVILQSMRKQSLLDLARNAEFLFESLALAFALDQLRMFQNTSGLCAERLQNLAVQLGKRRGAP